MTTTLLLFVRKHWPALAAFLVMLGLVCWAYLQGVANGKAERTAYYEATLAERDRASAQALADALASAQAQAAEAMAAERAHLQAQAKTEQQFKTITRTVTEYVESKPDLNSCGLDPVGLCHWNSANRGGAGAAACNP
jgi:hypothetical protein